MLAAVADAVIDDRKNGPEDILMDILRNAYLSVEKFLLLMKRDPDYAEFDTEGMRDFEVHKETSLRRFIIRSAHEGLTFILAEGKGESKSLSFDDCCELIDAEPDVIRRVMVGRIERMLTPAASQVLKQYEEFVKQTEAL